MSSRQPPHYPQSQAKRREPKTVPSMATPRGAYPPKKPGFLAWLFVIAILGGLIWLFMLIFALGPYADEKPPTPHPTSIAILPPSSMMTQVPTITATGAAPAALTPTHTLAYTPTISPSPTPELFPFILIGEPEMMSSDLLRPSLGCDWLVVAGQVWDLKDRAVKGLELNLTGELKGYWIDEYSVTGSAPVYGVSGYEFLLENFVVNSQDALFIQLVDADGAPYSLAYPLQTFQDCQKNLILVNFKQVRSE